MCLWPYRGAVPSLTSAQNQRQAGMCPLCSCLMCWGTSSACLHIQERGRRHLQVVYLGRWGWGIPLHAPSLNSLVLFTPQTASPCPCSGTRQFSLPPAYLLTGDAAWPQQRWSVSFPHAALPPYFPFSPVWDRPQLSSSVSPAVGRHQRRPAIPCPDGFYYT